MTEYRLYLFDRRGEGSCGREAVDMFGMLIVCGFAFAPEVDDTRLNFGNLTVLKARINQDPRMADKLKATRAGNLFVVVSGCGVAKYDIYRGIYQAEGAAT